jgi:hypothetical protein
MNLGSRLDLDTPSTPDKLPDFDDKDVKDLILKLNDDAIKKDEDSVYHGKWKRDVSPFYTSSLTFFSRSLIKMRYRGRGQLQHDCASHVSSWAFSGPWLII